MFGRSSLSSQKTSSAMNENADYGLLLLRLTVGGLLAGHGTQKISHFLGGQGFEGTAGWMESMGLKPGRRWAALASASELGGGLLTALGLAWPVGPIAIQGAMISATRRVHWGKPIWVAAGGAELPVVNMTAGLALLLTGPGKFTLDRALGIKMPPAVGVIAALAVGVGLVAQEFQAAMAPFDDRPEPEAGAASAPASSTPGEQTGNAGAD